VIPRTGIWDGWEEPYFTLPAVEIGHYSGRQVQLQRTAEVQISMDDWLAFLGVWMTDGSIGPSYRVSIAQKVGERSTQIAELLERLPFGFHGSNGEFYSFDKQLSSYLSRFGKGYEKWIPDFVRALCPRQISTFLNWFALDDATLVRRGWRIFYTASARLADGLQELLLKIGRIGTVKCRTGSRHLSIADNTARGTRPEYEVHDRFDKMDSWLDRRDIRRMPYEGTVYCATVPNHVMYVRRNGHPYWCGNTLMFWSERSRLYDETLVKFKTLLAEMGFVGYFDINCIVNARGIYPLEITPRFGYPTINIQMEGVASRWSDFLYALANKQQFALRTQRGFQIGVVVAVPPYPFSDPAAYRRYSEDAVIIFKKAMPTGIHHGDAKLVEGDWRLAGNSGYALVVTGSGATVEEARRETYNRVRNVIIPNMFYRTDIGERWHRDGDLLQTWGYLS
jgi:hypothetical protein